MSKKINPICVKDKALLQLGDKLVGSEMLLEDLAEKRAKLTRKFWEKAQKLYPELDVRKKAYGYNYLGQTIREKD